MPALLFFAAFSKEDRKKDNISGPQPEMLSQKALINNQQLLQRVNKMQEKKELFVKSILQAVTKSKRNEDIWREMEWAAYVFNNMQTPYLRAFFSLLSPGKNLWEDKQLARLDAFIRKCFSSTSNLVPTMRIFLDLHPELQYNTAAGCPQADFLPLQQQPWRRPWEENVPAPVKQKKPKPKKHLPESDAPPLSKKQKKKLRRLALESGASSLLVLQGGTGHPSGPSALGAPVAAAAAAAAAAAVEGGSRKRKNADATLEIGEGIQG